IPGTTPPTSQLDWLSSTTAMIVLFWSRATRDLLKSFGWGIAATPSVRCSDEVATFPRRPPHSIFRFRGRRLASGRSLRAQRVETDPAKREFRSDSCLFAPPWGGTDGLGCGLCFPFPTPGDGQQKSRLAPIGCRLVGLLRGRVGVLRTGCFPRQAAFQGGHEIDHRGWGRPS